MTRSEQGFTLMELVVAISILGIITVAVTEAAIIGLKTTDSTSQRVTESVGAQTAANYFLTDAQSAKTVTPGSATCNGIAAVTFAWTENTSSTAGTPRRAVYSCATNGDLVRTSYANGGVAGQQYLATDVTAISLSCAPATCALPASVTMRVTACAKPASGSACAVPDSFTYDLTGQTRSSA